MHFKLRCDDWILRTFCYLLGEAIDPKPDDCPEHGGTAVAGCGPCRRRNAWKGRHHRRKHDYGVASRYHDLPGLADHVRKLVDEYNLTPTDVARLAGVYPQIVTALIYGSNHRRGVFINAEAAKAILAVKPPTARPPSHVDATGTRRRLQAMNRAGHSWDEIADALGYGVTVPFGWARPGRATVPYYAYEDVKQMYPKMLAEPPRRTDTGIVIRARNRGHLPACAFPGDTIDDPTYDPLKRLGCPPAGLRRRLRALACHKHGPRGVAAVTGEDPAQIERWMMGKPAPLYASYLIAEVYEPLSFTFGTDRVAGALARREGWAPPLAWDDIDNPTAQPHVDVHSDLGKKALALHSVVYDAVDGKIAAAALLPAEKREVVKILHRRGWSDRRIAAWLHWHPDLDKGADNVCKYREREGITGFGLALIGDPSIEAKQGLILWGAAA